MKISKLNPKDTTLDEIHAIQEVHYEQQKDWNFSQLEKHYFKITGKVAQEMGIEIKTVAPDTILTR